MQNSEKGSSKLFLSAVDQGGRCTIVLYLQKCQLILIIFTVIYYLPENLRPCLDPAEDA